MYIIIIYVQVNKSKKHKFHHPDFRVDFKTFHPPKDLLMLSFKINFLYTKDNFDLEVKILLLRFFYL